MFGCSFWLVTSITLLLEFITEGSTETALLTLAAVALLIFSRSMSARKVARSIAAASLIWHGRCELTGSFQDLRIYYRLNDEYEDATEHGLAMLGAMFSHANWSHVIGNMFALVRFQSTLERYTVFNGTLTFLLLFVGGSFAGFYLNHYLIDTFVEDINNLINDVTKTYQCSHWLCTDTGFNRLVHFGGSAVVNVANLHENIYIHKSKHVRRLGASGGVYSIIATSIACQIYSLLFGNGLAGLITFGFFFEVTYLYANGMDLYNELNSVPFSFAGINRITSSYRLSTL